MKRVVWFGVLLGAFGFSATPLPAQQRGFTLEQVLSYLFPTELVAAPRGNRLAWVFNSQGRRNMWVASCGEPCAGAEKFRARQLTRFDDDDGQEITSLQFAAGSNFLVFVRGGNKNQAGEVPNPTSNPEGVDQQVWTIPWAGGAPRRVDAGRSPAVSPGRLPASAQIAYVKENQVWIAPLAGPGKPRQIVARGQNGSAAWSPDGKRLAFVSNRTTHSFIGVYDTAKRTLTYLAPSVDRDTLPRWSPDGKSLAFVRQPARTSEEAGAAFLTAPDRPRPWAIWVADVSTGKAREVWRSSATPEGSLPNMAGDALLNWAADDRIVFASEQTGWMHLYSLPAAGGDAVALSSGECEFEHMSFTPDRRHILYSSNCGDINRRHLWRVPVAGGAPERLTLGEGIEWSPVVTGDANWIAHVASDSRRPAMPHVRPARGGESRMLAAQMLPKRFPSAELVAPQAVVVDSPDGLRIHSQLFVPAGCAQTAPCPAVVFMHGGPVRQTLLGWHNRGYYHRAYAFNQYLASKGYVVMSVNYRSGIGYGRAFREAKERGARGAAEYQDIVAAGRYLQSRPEVNPARVGLWGGSYGGYLTALGLARNSDLFAVGVDLHGVHDWATRQFGAAADGERARIARESSPVAAVEKWRSPVLLIHGDDDRNVDFAQTVDLAARLRRQSVPFEQLIYPDDVHDFLLYRNWLQILTAASDFFDRHLRQGGKEVGN